MPRICMSISWYSVSSRENPEQRRWGTSDIDVSGSEFAQTVDGTPQAVDAVPLKRRQHLKGEGRRRVFDKV